MFGIDDIDEIQPFIDEKEKKQMIHDQYVCELITNALKQKTIKNHLSKFDIYSAIKEPRHYSLLPYENNFDLNYKLKKGMMDGLSPNRIKYNHYILLIIREIMIDVNMTTNNYKFYDICDGDLKFETVDRLVREKRMYCAIYDDRIYEIKNTN